MKCCGQSAINEFLLLRDKREAVSGPHIFLYVVHQID